MSDLKWETPPPQRRGRGFAYDEIAAALRSRPGEWALIAEDIECALVSRINKGTRRVWQPAGAFEARGQIIRTDGKTKRSKVWARYVGEPIGPILDRHLHDCAVVAGQSIAATYGSRRR